MFDLSPQYSNLSGLRKVIWWSLLIYWAYVALACAFNLVVSFRVISAFYGLYFIAQLLMFIFSIVIVRSIWRLDERGLRWLVIYAALTALYLMIIISKGGGNVGALFGVVASVLMVGVYKFVLTQRTPSGSPQNSDSGQTIVHH